jgi:hypothetical protein
LCYERVDHWLELGFGRSSSCQLGLGGFIDSIENLQDPIGTHAIINGDGQGWIILDIDESYPITRETMWEAYYRIAVADAYQNPWLHAPECSKITNEGSVGSIASGKKLFVNPLMLEAVMNRCLARACKGFLSLVPAEARKGDDLCLLKDGNFCYVLRADGDYHIFIGECYVHGFMYGETIDILDKDQHKATNSQTKMKGRWDLDDD